MNRNRAIATLAILAVLVLVGAVLWPPGIAGTAPLDVRFVGYGTDGAGGRTAEFMLTNRGELALLRETHCRVEYADDPLLVPGLNVAAPRSLNPGETEMVTVPAPPGRGKWRAGFKVLQKDRRFEAVDWANKHSLLPEAVRTRNYNARIKFGWSDWIAN